MTNYQTPQKPEADTGKGAQVQALVRNPTAGWTVELHCDCPACGEWVDLLDYPDFWDGRHLDIAEHGTARSKDVEVFCPECGHEFNVDLEY